MNDQNDLQEKLAALIERCGGEGYSLHKCKGCGGWGANWSDAQLEHVKCHTCHGKGELKMALPIPENLAWLEEWVLSHLDNCHICIGIVRTHVTAEVFGDVDTRFARVVDADEQTARLKAAMQAATKTLGET